MVVYFGEPPEDLKLKLEGNMWCEIYSTIGSTNARMKQCLETEQVGADETGFVGLVGADQQTAGRGRLAKQWSSPAAVNTYTSFGFQLPASTELYGLSLAVGICVRDVIFEITGLQNVAVKWPNDIYASDRKLGGILIEAFQKQGLWHIVVGIGLNVNQVEIDPQNPIDQPWTSLLLEGGCVVSRGRLIEGLLRSIRQCFQVFARHGWSPFRDRWRDVDWLYGREVQVHGHEYQLQGLGLGVDDQGRLLVRDSSGTVHDILSGEVSVREASISR